MLFMESEATKGRGRRLFAIAALGATVSAVSFAWLRPSHGQVPAALSNSAFCLVAPVEAMATPSDRADVQFNATVPLTNPTDWVTASATPAAKGDVVRVSVTSPRDGGIAIHGLTTLRPIRAGERIDVEFRAIYSGRFAIHFHGAGGAHFEIAAIEVRPTFLSSAETAPKP